VPEIVPGEREHLQKPLYHRGFLGVKRSAVGLVAKVRVAGSNPVVRSRNPLTSASFRGRHWRVRVTLRDNAGREAVPHTFGVGDRRRCTRLRKQRRTRYARPACC
jgi:hypothetical protein